MDPVEMGAWKAWGREFVLEHPPALLNPVYLSDTADTP